MRYCYCLSVLLNAIIICSINAASKQQGTNLLEAVVSIHQNLSSDLFCDYSPQHIENNDYRLIIGNFGRMTTAQQQSLWCKLNKIANLPVQYDDHLQASPIALKSINGSTSVIINITGLDTEITSLQNYLCSIGIEPSHESITQQSNKTLYAKIPMNHLFNFLKKSNACPNLYTKALALYEEPGA